MTTPGRAEQDRFRGETLPDLLGPHTRLLFVGVNPGLSAVAVQAPFPRRGNRFYPALFKAGITDRLIDASAGFAPGDRDYLIDRGIGITALVSRATARAAELSPAELRAGARDLLTTVTRVKPQVVAILGITAYRTAFARPKASTGRQPGLFAGTQLWVVPNPSGLNAHASLADLSAAYREVAIAAGLDLRPVDRLRPGAPDGPVPGGGGMAPAARRAGDRTGQGEMVMLPDSVAWFPALSVTLMVNLDVPAVVGVPLRWLPVSVTPGGMDWPSGQFRPGGGDHKARAPRA